MLVEHVMEAGSAFPRHSHLHAQLAHLVSGHIREGGGQAFEARGGDGFVLKGGVEHEVHALEKSVALDVFAPYREDHLPSDGAN